MKVKLNPNETVVKTIKEGLKQTGGYCPCRIERTEDTKCMCKEFRELRVRNTITTSSNHNTKRRIRNNNK